jgi:hypothetical protein
MQPLSETATRTAQVANHRCDIEYSSATRNDRTMGMADAGERLAMAAIEVGFRQLLYRMR